jgi:hypothetical protein
MSTYQITQLLDAVAYLNAAVEVDDYNKARIEIEKAEEAIARYKRDIELMNKYETSWAKYKPNKKV